MITCIYCQEVGWVCEEHPGLPWAGAQACGCGAAGMPCSACDVPENGEAPRMPGGFEIEDDKDGWLQ